MKARVAAGAVIAIAIAAAVLATRPHASPRPKEDPRAFAAHIVRLIATNRYATAWETLHPLDQRVASRNEYVRCESRSPIVAKVRDVRVLGVSADAVGLGDGKFIPSTAVSVRIAFAGDASFVVDHAVHLVAVDGKWRWVLTPWRYRVFKANRCPDAAPSAPSASA